MEISFTTEFLARFQIVSRAGEGGMGIVYRAVQTSLLRPVAIKFLSPHLTRTEFRARFETEARLAAQLFHSNLVAVIETGLVNDTPYIVFELVDGPNLREYTESSGGRLPLLTCLSIARQTADGLACAHRAGIIHRDVKPENILLSSNFVVKVADFGVAKGGSTGDVHKEVHRTQSGIVCGTPTYMSPEHARGADLTWTCDIYSLGVVLYEMLAHRPPFAGSSAWEVLDLHVRRAPPPLPDRVPSPVQELVFRMLEKTPDSRPASMGKVSRELARLENDLRQQPDLDSAVPLVPRMIATNPLKIDPGSGNVIQSSLSKEPMSAPSINRLSTPPVWLSICGSIFLVTAGFFLGTPSSKGDDLLWSLSTQAIEKLQTESPDQAMKSYQRLLLERPNAWRAGLLSIWMRLEDKGATKEAISDLEERLLVPLEQGKAEDIRRVNDILLSKVIVRTLDRIRDSQPISSLINVQNDTVLRDLIVATQRLCTGDPSRAYDQYDEVSKLIKSRHQIPSGEACCIRPLLTLSWLRRLARNFASDETVRKSFDEERLALDRYEKSHQPCHLDGLARELLSLMDRCVVSKRDSVVKERSTEGWSAGLHPLLARQLSLVKSVLCPAPIDSSVHRLGT